VHELIEGNATVQIESVEVERLLGYRDGRVTPRGRELVARAIAEASPLVEAHFAHRRIARTSLDGSRFLRTEDDAVLCVATIGRRLEERAEACSRNGETGLALAVEACGAVAVEYAADAAERSIRDEIAATGLKCSRRFSPGYGGWDVAEQRWLFDVLGAPALGVTLTAGCMMSPRKSISFAVTVGTEPREMRSAHPCDECDMVTCAYRRPARSTNAKGESCQRETRGRSGSCPLGRWSE
jgi:hypothetical protein